MINLGKAAVKVLCDGWTAVTRDRSLSAQFEHSVGVTENGVEIFTLSPHGHTSRPIRCDRPRRGRTIVVTDRTRNGRLFGDH